MYPSRLTPVTVNVTLVTLVFRLAFVIVQTPSASVVQLALKLSGSSLTPLTMAPNGTRLGDWLLNTFDNRIWAAADYDGDHYDELLITSPWGIGVLEWTGAAIDSLMLEPNGTRFDGWLLNTRDNQFRTFQDITGNHRAGILVESPWGIGIMTLQGTTFQVPVMEPNGTRLGRWLLNTHDNQF